MTVTVFGHRAIDLQLENYLGYLIKIHIPKLTSSQTTELEPERGEGEKEAWELAF